MTENDFGTAIYPSDRLTLPSIIYSVIFKTILLTGLDSNFVAQSILVSVSKTCFLGDFCMRQSFDVNGIKEGGDI